MKILEPMKEIVEYKFGEETFEIEISELNEDDISEFYEIIKEKGAREAIYFSLERSTKLKREQLSYLYKRIGADKFALLSRKSIELGSLGEVEKK